MLLSCNAVPVANMQTFPPASNARGSGVGSTTTSNNNNRGYQTMGAPTDGVEQQAPPTTWKGVFSISSYIQYFNVDTDIVVNRLMSSFYPIGGDFFSKIDANPDLWVYPHSTSMFLLGRLSQKHASFIYGLVWISTTLVFLLSYLGNFATYLMLRHTDRSASRSFDVGYVNTAAVAIYGYAITVPMGFYFLLQYLGLSTSLIRFWCMWGYSLFIFVPCSVVLVIPVEFMRWVIILAAGVDSACFVTANLKTVVEVVEGGDLTIVLVASFLLQLALAIFIKVWFFP
ncbi:Protein YIPF1 homolog [Linum grandiflorum]